MDEVLFNFATPVTQDITLTAHWDVDTSCGDDIIYFYDAFTKTLTLSGTGATKTYGYGTTNPSPFYNWNIQSVIINEGVTYLGSYFFAKCKSLQSVTIPESITGISNQAFSECTSLHSIYYAGTEAQWAALNFTTTATIYYLEDALQPLGCTLGNVTMSNGNIETTLHLSGMCLGYQIIAATYAGEQQIETAFYYPQSLQTSQQITMEAHGQEDRLVIYVVDEAYMPLLLEELSIQ